MRRERKGILFCALCVFFVFAAVLQKSPDKNLFKFCDDVSKMLNRIIER